MLQQEVGPGRLVCRDLAAMFVVVPSSTVIYALEIYLVYILPKTNANVSFFCSTNTNRWQVSLGRQNLQGTNPNEVTRTVARIILHPNYDSNTNNNDIALLKLSSPVKFTDYIRPVCLAASSSVFNNGTDSWVTGWGAVKEGVSLPFPETLQEVEVPVLGNRQCNCLNGVGTVTREVQWWQSDMEVSLESLVLVLAVLQPICQESTQVSSYTSWINSLHPSDKPGFVQFAKSELTAAAPVLVCHLLHNYYYY
ncbi:prostasin-like%2C partial [Scomber scombrus]|uniref:Prostasin-like, partial n=1 Tax=Scomber scombrus TaxID=13677 RepID=A0AAV1PHR1_SCOSC